MAAGVISRTEPLAEALRHAIEGADGCGALRRCRHLGRTDPVMCHCSLPGFGTLLPTETERMDRYGICPGTHAASAGVHSLATPFNPGARS